MLMKLPNLFFVSLIIIIVVKATDSRSIRRIVKRTLSLSTHDRFSLWVLGGGGGLCRSHATLGVNSSYIWADPPLQLFATTWHIERFIFCKKRRECEEFTDWFCRRVWIFLARISQNSLQIFDQFVLAQEHGAKWKARTLKLFIAANNSLLKLLLSSCGFYLFLLEWLKYWAVITL